MYWAMAIILFANWVLGLVSGAHLGLWIHLLLAAALLALALAVVDATRVRPAESRRTDDIAGG